MESPEEAIALFEPVSARQPKAPRIERPDGVESKETSGFESSLRYFATRRDLSGTVTFHATASVLREPLPDAMPQDINVYWCLKDLFYRLGRSADVELHVFMRQDMPKLKSFIAEKEFFEVEDETHVRPSRKMVRARASKKGRDVQVDETTRLYDVEVGTSSA